MKIKIEMDENLTEDEVVIRCASITDELTFGEEFSIEKR